MERRERLQRLLSPKRVAWVGGGGMAPALGYMGANGYPGEVIAVNPQRAEIDGVPCVASVADLPWTPDVAVLVIPKDAVIGVVRELSAVGCVAAICITSGFKEADGGADLQASLIDAAGDMPIVGPNCPGIANFLDGHAFMMDHFGIHAPDRGAAVISNGGAYLSDLGCADRSQPIAYLIGLGNQAMVGIPDMLDLVLDDPRVTAVNLYFEGMGDVAALSECAAKAARKGIPIVAIKGGRSDAGKRATQSHTASMAGDAEIASALFRRFGWIEVSTPAEAIETLKMLSYTPIPKGLRTGFVTSSGSYAVLGGDIAGNVGLQMDLPHDEHAGALDTALPAYVGPANPLDISDAHGWSRDQQLPIYQAFAANNYDLYAQVMCYPPEGGWDMATWDTTTDALADAVHGRPVAFVNTLAESLPRSVRERMIANGMAPLQDMEDGLRAVANAAHYGGRRDNLDPDSMRLPPPTEVGGDTHTLGEDQAKSMLHAAGLDIPAQWIAQRADNVPDVSCTTAVKAIVPGLLHKTEAGAVALNVAPDALSTTIADMATRLREQDLRPNGFLVEEMITAPVAELMIGLRRVEGVGAVLTMASGGTAVELLDDQVTEILPLETADIDAGLRRLRLSPLFLGYRGRQPANLDAVKSTIARLCAFLLERPALAELEINPLLLTADRAVIVDAVVTSSRKAEP